MATIIALPGWHVGRMRDEAAAIRMIHLAYDLGINFFDSAWAYEEGRSENRLGKALGPRRQKIFLMTKIIARDRKAGQAQFEESLRRLQTDHVDLLQIHGLQTPADIDKIWGPDGVWEMAEKARQEGKVRHLGFTGHRDPNVHLKAIEQYHDVIETVQMPLNPVDVHYSSFERIVLPVAKEYDIGVIAMKSVAQGALVGDRIATAAECHRYVWTLPVSLIVAGVDTPAQLEENVESALQFQPMAQGEIAALLERTKPHAGAQLETYKSDLPLSQWKMYPKEPVL